MPHFDVEWLDSLGYDALAEPQKHRVLRAAYDALELRVGAVLSARLPDHLLQEFESIMNDPRASVSDSLAVKFLADNIPDYRQTTNTLFQQLGEELRQIRADFRELQKSPERQAMAGTLTGDISPAPSPAVSDTSPNFDPRDNDSEGTHHSGPQTTGGSNQ